MLLCSISNMEESIPVGSAVSKTMTTKKVGRVAVETTRLCNNSSHRADHPSLEVKASPLVFKDSSSNNSNKSEESIRLPRAADGRTKVLVDGAEAQPNPVVGKAVRFSSVYKDLNFRHFFRCAIYDLHNESIHCKRKTDYFPFCHSVAIAQ